MEKRKITEIKETYQKRVRLRGDEVAADGSKFEVQEKTKYREVITVDGWARFGHYLLDIVFYYIIVFMVTILLIFVLAALGYDVSGFTQENNASELLMRLFNWLILYPGYYILFEGTMQSTPGKLIMKRVVVNEYGEKPDIASILKRSYIRVIPFEIFSCLSNTGWHDRWTETFVIRKKDLHELQLLAQLQDI